MLVTLPRYPAAPMEVTWKLRQPSQANRSEFTGARRVTILAEAPRWTAQVKYAPIFGDRAMRPWRAALAMMQGRVGTFRLPAFEQIQPVAGQAVVDGGDQIGMQVRLRGFTARSVLRTGWFITIGERLHQIVHEVLPDENGKVLVSVIPYVAGYADGTPVALTAPYALMSLSDDEAGWTVGPGQRYDVAFNCEEAF